MSHQTISTFHFVRTILILMSLGTIAGCPDDPEPVGRVSKPGEHGHFEGEVVVRWSIDEGEDRDMTLVNEFKYVDPEGKEWLVPANTTINGASIPRVFWIKYPRFVGNYRLASVVHDHYCEELLSGKSKDWEEIQLMFYHACRCGGMDDTEAKVFYNSVYSYWKLWSASPETFENLSNMKPREVSEMRSTVPANSVRWNRPLFSERSEATDPEKSPLRMVPAGPFASDQPQLSPENDFLILLESANQQIEQAEPSLDEIRTVANKIVKEVTVSDEE